LGITQHESQSTKSHRIKKSRMSSMVFEEKRITTVRALLLLATFCVFPLTTPHPLTFFVVFEFWRLRVCSVWDPYWLAIFGCFCGLLRGVELKACSA
jgi:hypothetical protein